MPVLVVMCIFNHCPYVQAVEDRILSLNREYTPRGVQLVGICANDPTDYPDDRPENLLRRWREKGYGFPYLIDESQDVARAFGAVCTPDIYVFDPERKLAYHGRIDDNAYRPGTIARLVGAGPAGGFSTSDSMRWSRSATRLPAITP